ncbi:MAG TPA: glycoside hydrolase, partial [Sphingomicrobium sp.]
GPSNLPDPDYHAFRKDLADVALAGRVIASHYAEPLERRIVVAAPLRDAPGEDGAEVRQLQSGERFALLDDSLGWAWGYAGEDRRVGYVPSAALAQ